MKKPKIKVPEEASLPGLPDSNHQNSEADVRKRIETAKSIIKDHPEVAFEEALLLLSPLPRLAFTLKETGRILGISYVSVWRLVKKGVLKCSNAVPARPLIARDEIKRYLETTSTYSK